VACDFLSFRNPPKVEEAVNSLTLLVHCPRDTVFSDIPKSEPEVGPDCATSVHPGTVTAIDFPGRPMAPINLILPWRILRLSPTSTPRAEMASVTALVTRPRSIWRRETKVWREIRVSPELAGSGNPGESKMRRSSAAPIVSKIPRPLTAVVGRPLTELAASARATKNGVICMARIRRKGPKNEKKKSGDSQS
jgi:hypothetical protein